MKCLGDLTNKELQFAIALGYPAEQIMAEALRRLNTPFRVGDRFKYRKSGYHEDATLIVLHDPAKNARFLWWEEVGIRIGRARHQMLYVRPFGRSKKLAKKFAEDARGSSSSGSSSSGSSSGSSSSSSGSRDVQD